jgi:hypothetical protein
MPHDRLPIRRFRPYALAGVAAVALACGDPAGPQPALHVATDRAHYARGAVVRVTVENVGGKAVALSGCPQPPSAYLERHAGRQWDATLQFGILCSAIYRTETVALAPGERLAFSFDMPDAGAFRVRVLGGVDLRYPDAVGVSRPFTVD